MASPSKAEEKANILAFPLEAHLHGPPKASLNSRVPPFLHLEK
jgi:hypothetical protein